MIASTALEAISIASISTFLSTVNLFALVTYALTIPARCSAVLTIVSIPSEPDT